MYVSINVACIAVFKLLSMFWYVEYLTKEMAAPESIKGFVVLYCMYCYSRTIHDECYCYMFV